MDHSRSAAFYSAAKTRHDAPAPRHDTPTTQAPELPKRKYEIMYLDHTNQMREKNLIARTHAAFEQAFSVLKQGAIVQAEHGFVSVEDVMPGDKLRLANGLYEPVHWRGSITLGLEDDAANAPSAALTRITSDAMGYNRPSPDLVLGHGARILHRAAGIKRVSGNDAAFIPAADFIDGNNVLSLLPATPTALYQFGFRQQESLSVNGIEVETLHPGSAFNLGLRGSSLRAFMSLFPHKHTFEDFGLLRTPRLRLRDLDLLT